MQENTDQNHAVLILITLVLTFKVVYNEKNFS